MIRNNLPTLLFAMTAAIAVSGCTSLPSPTHSWEAPVTEVRYHADNRNCSPDSKPRRAFVATSHDFASYKDCMQGLGYEWVALR